MLAILRVADRARKSTGAPWRSATVALLADAAALELGDGRGRFDKRGPFEADRGAVIHFQASSCGGFKAVSRCRPSVKCRVDP